MRASKDYSNIAIEFHDLRIELEDIVGEEVQRFYSELYKSSPIDTTRFKGSWTPISHAKGSMKWTWMNKAPYASILARGRDFVNGRWYGSNKNGRSAATQSAHGWGGGIKPFAYRFEKRVVRRTRDVRN